MNVAYLTRAIQEKKTCMLSISEKFYCYNIFLNNAKKIAIQFQHYVEACGISYDKVSAFLLSHPNYMLFLDIITYLFIIPRTETKKEENLFIPNYSDRKDSIKKIIPHLLKLSENDIHQKFILIDFVLAGGLLQQMFVDDAEFSKRISSMNVTLTANLFAYIFRKNNASDQWGGFLSYPIKLLVCLIKELNLEFLPPSQLFDEEAELHEEKQIMNKQFNQKMHCKYTQNIFKVY